MTEKRVPWQTDSQLWKELKPAARSMRANPTPGEATLWQHLRGAKLAGVRFRRQHAIGKFIVDFYCPQAKLVIELDGSSHVERETEDQVRTDYLKQQGLSVLRFTNTEVRENLEAVLAKIAQAIGDATATRPSASPLSARGEGDRG
jgi:very-short-patch-repair endonuclease